MRQKSANRLKSRKNSAYLKVSNHFISVTVIFLVSHKSHFFFVFSMLFAGTLLLVVFRNVSGSNTVSTVPVESIQISYFIMAVFSLAANALFLVLPEGPEFNIENNLVSRKTPTEFGNRRTESHL
jgi:hypothetical protein